MKTPVLIYPHGFTSKPNVSGFINTDRIMFGYKTRDAETCIWLMIFHMEHGQVVYCLLEDDTFAEIVTGKV